MEQHLELCALRALRVLHDRARTLGVPVAGGGDGRARTQRVHDAPPSVFMIAAT